MGKYYKFYDSFNSYVIMFEFETWFENNLLNYNF